MSEKKKLKIYFAHPYESIGTFAEYNIITELKKRGFEVVNPFDGENEMMLEKYNRTCGYYPNPPLQMGYEIWDLDMKRVIEECDALLVFVPEGTRLSGGCGIETWEALKHDKMIWIISHSKHPVFAYILKKSVRAIMYESINDWINHHPIDWE